jgi:hypothetical protein
VEVIAEQGEKAAAQALYAERFERHATSGIGIGRAKRLALVASQPESLLTVMPLHLCSQVLWRSL